MFIGGLAGSSQLLKVPRLWLQHLAKCCVCTWETLCSFQKSLRIATDQKLTILFPRLPAPHKGGAPRTGRSAVSLRWVHGTRHCFASVWTDACTYEGLWYGLQGKNGQQIQPVP